MARVDSILLPIALAAGCDKDVEILIDWHFPLRALFA